MTRKPDQQDGAERMARSRVIHLDELTEHLPRVVYRCQHPDGWKLLKHLRSCRDVPESELPDLALLVRAHGWVLLVRHLPVPPKRFRLGCYHCAHEFDVPAGLEGRFARIRCPACRKQEQHQHYRCHDQDPGKHPLGWPYSDPTVPYDT